MSSNRTIRRSQVISPFGVGAIYDIGNESLVSCDISTWGNSGDEIHLERLEKLLSKVSKTQIKAFRMPPVSENFWQKKGPKLEFHRFPRWLFCSSCRKMYLWSLEKEKEGCLPECEKEKCKGKKTTLVPMRFVLACTDGHLMDLPWDKWVHAEQNIAKNGRCEKKNCLEFRTRKNAGSGLGSLEIFCESCNGRRTLEGIAYKDSMKSLMRCYGKQPWQYESVERCESTPQVLQRGASNAYYPKTVSALDIPLKVRDRSKEDLIESIRMDPNFIFLAKVVNSSEGDLDMDSTSKKLVRLIAETHRCEDRLILELLTAGSDEDEGDTGGRTFSDQEILAEEWPLLFDPPKDKSLSDQFIGEIVNDTGKDEHGILKYIDRVVLLHKLREVRVFRGFHRVEPREDDKMVRADLGKGKNWLPGIEVFGEGIFIAFKESSLQKWVESENHSIEKRMDPMIKRWKDRSLKFLPAPHARFVMLHTFAHLLIRQLSFECGYSASSLKERIYSADPSDGSSTPMSGILIYTADSDSEGSLGGLVRQGFPDRLFPAIYYSLMKSSWCSSDPICTELGGQGLMGLNQAACHGCALISETSCSYSNVLLDRALVTGRSDISGRTGFFSDLLYSIEAKL